MQFFLFFPGVIFKAIAVHCTFGVDLYNTSRDFDCKSR